jgi:transcriptional regulator with XRE-family HTH domain
MAVPQFVGKVLARLKELRIKAGFSEAHLERELILGPGWIARFEAGEVVPTLDVLLAILNVIGADFDDLTKGISSKDAAAEIDRAIYAEAKGSDLIIRFRYADHDAQYRLPNATLEQFEKILLHLRDGLARLTKVASPVDGKAETVKADSVAQAFLKAVKIWPHANPSDLWGFLISRAYCDPFNHPAAYSRLDHGQSWKRTSGWALEEILVRHYGPFLKKHDINIFIAAGGDRKQNLLDQLDVADLEADKVDVLLSGEVKSKERCFGVVHVKASFAERRTDDVPMSQALVAAGYTSPLWTFDLKSGPSANPVNRGELGAVLATTGILGMPLPDTRSAKRRDIEVAGHFSACFSYNANTKPTPVDQKKAKARISVCDFRNPDDTFSQFIRAEWDRFLHRRR